LQFAKSLVENRKLCGGQLANPATGCTSAAPFAEDVCQFSDRESDGQSGSNQSHSMEAVWREHSVASGSTGGWKQKIPPFVETHRIRTYAGKTG
jgi:hypothetical protein